MAKQGPILIKVDVESIKAENKIGGQLQRHPLCVRNEEGYGPYCRSLWITFDLKSGPFVTPDFS